MKVDYQKLCKAITALYCENKKNRPEHCLNKECEAGQCLCIDEEQISLLAGLLEFPITIKMSDGKMKVAAGESLEQTMFCTDRSPNEKKLVSCGKLRNENSDADLIQVIEESLLANATGRRYVLENLPVIQTVNMINDIDDRDSIHYMCLFGNYAPEIFKTILLGLTGRMILCHLNNENQKELEAEIEKFFEKLQELYLQENFNKFKSKLLHNIVQYSNCFGRETGSMHICWGILRKYYSNAETLLCKYDERQGPYNYITASESDREIEHIHNIFLKISEITGINLGTAYKKFFKKKRKIEFTHNTYDLLNTVLENADDTKINSMLCDLQKLLVCKDNLEDDEQIENFADKYLQRN